MSTITPILRIFDYDKTVEFYVNWLGFTIDWEHEFEPGTTPKYIQVSLRDIILHLSEHHGDASPGSHIRINDFTGLRAYNKELIGKKYKYGRPGVEVPPWNEKSIYMTVHDPFGNKITFNEDVL
jgi:catechol 2,3-dioxygenase-like lactoylglutathione lyase family enzyme